LQEKPNQLKKKMKKRSQDTDQEKSRTQLGDTLHYFLEEIVIAGLLL